MPIQKKLPCYSFFLYCFILCGLLLVLVSCRNRATQVEAPPVGNNPTANQPAKDFFDKQLLSEVLPEEVGMSSKRVAQIDTVIQRYIEKKYAPGVVCLVARKGKIVFYKARGVKDMALELPLNRSDIFRIMSMTKAITSVAVMMLYEEGKLMLDDPVSKYISSFAEPRILRRIQLGRDTTYTASPARQEPTIRHLLSHTSGIGYSNPLYKKYKIPDFYTYDSLTLAQTIPVLGSLPLLHEPGERFSYGLNTDVLGHIVEVVSGLSLADFFEKRIFRPLGMEDTHFYLPPRKAERLVMLYQSPEPGELRAVRNSIAADFPLHGAKTYYSGGAGLCSTALDYARFLQMLLNGGRFNGTQLLSRKSIEMMGKNQIGDLHVWDGVNKFGLGFRITTEAGSAVFPWSEGSLSWGGLYRTDYWIDPKEELQVVIMTQVWPSKAPYLHDQLKPVIYQAIID